MRFIGPENKRVSPYMDELVRTQAVQRLANIVSLLQTTTQTSTEGFDFLDGQMQSLLADVCSVGEEYMASPDDIQLALQINDKQLVIGAEIADI
jgi:phage tail tape-measure protein